MDTLLTALQYTSEKTADTISLFLDAGKDASFSLYEDENKNYDFEKGPFSHILFSYNENKHQLVIGKRKGNFPGMLMQGVVNLT